MFFFVNWGSLDFLIESHTTQTRDWNFENRLLGEGGKLVIYKINLKKSRNIGNWVERLFIIYRMPCFIKT